MSRFAGKVALITGAASGIGTATATKLAQEGASVLAVDVNEDGLTALVSDVSAAGDVNGTIQAHKCDVSKPAQCVEAVEACLEAFGGLHVVGNFAGICWQKHALEVTEDDWDQMFDVNVKGTFFVAQAALPHLVESAGSLINIASNSGLTPMAYTVVYGASKSAIVSLTRSLALEYIKTPVRINAIAPGGVNTPLIEGVVPPSDGDRHLLAKATPLRSMSEADQIVALFVFLVSDEASNIHGAIISADHGASL